MLLRTLLFLLPLLAACTGDGGERPAGQRTGAQADSAGMMGMPGEEMVTPAESVQAARETQQHADSIRNAITRDAGADRADVPRPPRPVGDSPEERYRACRDQAAQAEGEVRQRLEQICADIRTQPER